MVTIKEKAFEMIGIFEDFLANRNIEIPNQERDEYEREGNNEEQGIIFGSDFDDLQEELVNTLKNEKFYSYQLADDNSQYGILKTTAEEEEFLKLVDEYKADDENDYNTDGLVEYLKEKGHKAEIISVDRVVFF